MTTTVYRPSASSTGDSSITGDLSVTGDASVTQDLTIDTSTLFVDSANDRVGVGTLTPDAILDVHLNSASETAALVQNHGGGANAHARIDILDSSANSKLRMIAYSQAATGTTFGSVVRAGLKQIFDNSITSKTGGFLLGVLQDASMYFGTNSVVRLEIDSSGNIIIAGDTLRVSTQKTPASAAATGTKGDIVHDTGFVYVCTATDTWKRVAIATW